MDFPSTTKQNNHLTMIQCLSWHFINKPIYKGLQFMVYQRVDID